MTRELNEVMTRSEAQAALRVNKRTMLKLIRSGAFPGAYQVTDRGDWRVPAADIDKFRTRNQVQAAGGVS